MPRTDVSSGTGSGLDCVDEGSNKRAILSCVTRLTKAIVSVPLQNAAILDRLFLVPIVA